MVEFFKSQMCAENFTFWYHIHTNDFTKQDMKSKISAHFWHSSDIKKNSTNILKLDCLNWMFPKNYSMKLNTRIVLTRIWNSIFEIRHLRFEVFGFSEIFQGSVVLNFGHNTTMNIFCSKSAHLMSSNSSLSSKNFLQYLMIFLRRNYD